MNKSSVPLCVSITKLYLEPGSVIGKYFFARKRDVVREEQLLLAIWHLPYDNSNFTIESLRIGNQRICRPLCLFHLHFLHSCEVKLIHVYLAVLCLRSSPFTCSWTVIDIV